jgi:hypothetical protein
MLLPTHVMMMAPLLSLPASAGLGRADKTLEGYQASIGHLNAFLADNQFPPFKELMPEYIKGDH